MPARLKFLRSDATETSHILATPCNGVALAYPDRRVRLTSAGRALVDVAPAAGLLARARDLPRAAPLGDLHEVVGEDAIRIHALWRRRRWRRPPVVACSSSSGAARCAIAGSCTR
ncbi:MAG: hypothetical protein R2939_14255 [Kofleriaceae bacterium]